LDLGEIRTEHDEHCTVDQPFGPPLRAAALRGRESLFEVPILVQPEKVVVEDDWLDLGILQQRLEGE